MSYCDTHKVYYNSVTCVECFSEAAKRYSIMEKLKADPNYRGPFCSCCGAGKDEDHDRTCVWYEEKE